MKFTHEYFPDHIKIWKRFLSPYKGLKDINYLEVGVFEGQSAFWIKENILTHKSCKLNLVDYFHPLYEKQFLENLSEVNSENIILHKGQSSEKLRSFKPHQFDIIYIDGGHIAKDIFIDLALAWTLLKFEGTLIIDDYPLLKDKAPIHMRPGAVIDCFITSFSEEIEVLHKEWQVILKKRKMELKNISPYSWNKIQRIGEFFYNWHTHQLIDKDGNKSILDLSAKDKTILELILSNIEIGDSHFKLDKSLTEKQKVKELLQKLGIEFK